MDNLLNVPEAARLLRISVSTLYRWVYKKQIQHVKIGSRVLFSEKHILEFLDKSTILTKG